MQALLRTRTHSRHFSVKTAVSLGICLLIFAVLSAACAPAATPTAAPAAPTKAAAAPTAAAPAPTAAAPAATKPAAVSSPTSVPAAAEKPFSPPVTVKVGVVGLLADAGTFIGKEKGYFQAEGINVETVQFDSGGTQMAPLGTGELDVGMGAPGAGFFNAIARGITMKLVSDTTSAPKGFASNAIVVRKDLIESGKVKSPKDLKGMKFAVAAPNMFGDPFADALMRQDGLTYKDLDMVVVNYPDQIAAFANKNIDAAISVEPFVALLVQNGAAVRWKGCDEVFDNAQVAMHMFSSKFIKDKPEVANRYMVPYLKAVRDYNDAFVKNKNRSEVVKILAKYTAVKDLPLYDKMVPAGINPDGYMNLASVQSQIDWYVANGQVNQPMKAQDIVDHSFLDYAIGKLGKYQR